MEADKVLVVCRSQLDDLLKEIFARTIRASRHHQALRIGPFGGRVGGSKQINVILRRTAPELVDVGLILKSPKRGLALGSLHRGTSVSNIAAPDAEILGWIRGAAVAGGPGRSAVNHGERLHPHSLGRVHRLVGGREIELARGGLHLPPFELIRPQPFVPAAAQSGMKEHPEFTLRP